MKSNLCKIIFSTVVIIIFAHRLLLGAEINADLPQELYFYKLTSPEGKIAYALGETHTEKLLVPKKVDSIIRTCPIFMTEHGSPFLIENTSIKIGNTIIKIQEFATNNFIAGFSVKALDNWAEKISKNEQETLDASEPLKRMNWRSLSPASVILGYIIFEIQNEKNGWRDGGLDDHFEAIGFSHIRKAIFLENWVEIACCIPATSHIELLLAMISKDQSKASKSLSLLKQMTHNRNDLWVPRIVEAINNEESESILLSCGNGHFSGAENNVLLTLVKDYNFSVMKWVNDGFVEFSLLNS